MLSRQTHHDGGGVGQGDLSLDGRLATQRWALQVKEQKHAPKEALSATPLPEFVCGPGGRQAGAVLLLLGVPERSEFHCRWVFHAHDPSGGF